jgi:hypothetical protein
MAGAFNSHPASLEKLIALLPSPRHPLQGSRTAPLLLPDNIICFRRRSAADLNRPQRGRALHHRFVLILALQTAVTVLVDDRAIRLNANQGLLIFPFQFHDYIEPAQPELNWLFVTFELIDDGALAGLRFRPFMIKPAVGRLAAELVEAYLQSLARHQCEPPAGALPCFVRCEPRPALAPSAAGKGVRAAPPQPEPCFRSGRPVRLQLDL